MGVGDRFDAADDDSTSQGNGGRKSKSRKTTRKAARASAAPAALSSAGAEATRRPGDRSSDRYGDATDGREIALRALLDGLHDIEDGHFDVRLTPNGDPLMADVILAFNRVASRSESMIDESSSSRRTFAAASD